LSGFDEFDHPHLRRGRFASNLDRLWRRRRFLTILAFALLLSVGTIAASFFTPSDNYQQILINLGASFVGVVATVLILDPLIERSRKPEEVIHTEFPYALFLDGIAYSSRTIRIMGAWPYVMDHPWRKQFLAALTLAAERGVRIQILVLDPFSRAAEQRASDLDNRFDVTSVITDVLVTFMRLTDSLPPSAASRLEVRVYSSLPPARMYRWDGQAISSFFPMGNWVGSDIKHYETNMNSRLAQFVDEQFVLLWRDVDTVPVVRYMYVEVRISLADAQVESRSLEYVLAEETIYVAGHQIVDLLYRSGITESSAHVTHFHRGIQESSRLVLLSGPETENLRLHKLFYRKYGSSSPLDRNPSVFRIETGSDIEHVAQPSAPEAPGGPARPRLEAGHSGSSPTEPV
jgi:hypothetical protein